MRGLFEKITTKNCSSMSKSDKKKYNQLLGNIIDLKSEYKIVQIASKFKLFKDNTNKYLFFEYFDQIYPTIQNFDKNIFKTIFLDEGAIGPLTRGADVMIPGILKYKERSDKFIKNEVVGIEIIDQGVFAVGKCLMDFEEMDKVKEGPAIEVYHVKGDHLNRNFV